MAGQIRRRNENSWLIRIFLGREPNGKRKYFNKTIHGTKKDAQRYLTSKLREKDLGIFVEPASMFLNTYLEKWLEQIARPRIRPSTFSSYEMVLRIYVKPALGAKRLSDIRATDVQELYANLTKKGLSARTIRYAHVVLSSALKQAIRWQMIHQNPCELCELPRIENKEMKYFSPVQTHTFLETAKEDRYFVLFLIALETGMRPQEYLALQWKDIDLDKQLLGVRRAIVWKREGGGFTFTEPKTSKSRRCIPLSNSTIQALRVHRMHQLEERLKLGSKFQDFDLVFTSELGTPIQPKNLIDRHFKPLLRQAELPNLRLYDLRHTTATLLLSAGENPKIASERLGHASIVLTLDTYSHVLPTMQKNATETLERLIFGT